MKALLIAVLLTASVGAQAEWRQIGRDSNSAAYLWYPVEQYFPLAYPHMAGTTRQSVYVKGWKYRMKSLLWINTVDCRSGRMKIRYGYFYSGADLNGHKATMGSMTLSNGLKVIPNRWYNYSSWTTRAQKAIRWSCA